MLARLFTFLAGALCWSMNASAVSFVLCHSENLPGYLAIDPVNPGSSQPITITVGRYSYDPKSVTVEVHGNAIDVTLTANAIDILPPPAACIVAAVGPLAKGVYSVNLKLLDSLSRYSER